MEFVSEDSGKRTNLIKLSSDVPLPATLGDRMIVCIQCFPSNKIGTQLEGAVVNTLDNEGYTPLIRAAENGHHLCLNELIKIGADVNAKGSFGYTPLLMASVKDETECVAALIHAGADVNIRNDSGRTALYGAVVNRNIENIKQLLKSWNKCKPV